MYLVICIMKSWDIHTVHRLYAKNNKINSTEKSVVYISTSQFLHYSALRDHECPEVLGTVCRNEERAFGEEDGGPWVRRPVE
jgi:hypothetical protein